MKDTYTLNKWVPAIPKLLGLAIALMLPAAPAPAIVLIDPTTGNGSFEASTVSISPWQTVQIGTFSLTTTIGTNPADATHGNNHLSYDMTVGSGYNELDLARYFIFGQPFSTTTGVFALRFDIRGDFAPAITLRTIQADNSLTPIQPTLYSVNTPALSTSSYTTRGYEWQADPSWNSTQIELILSWVPYATHSADLDNFLLYQIPEPSVVLLSGVGGLLLLRRRRGRNG